MMVNALGSCHPDCTFCAREWFKWWAGRMNQMNRPRKGEKVSFSEAASTSVGANK